MGSGTYDIKWLLYVIISLVLTVAILLLLRYTVKKQTTKEAIFKIFALLCLLSHISIYYHNMIVLHSSETGLSTFFPIYPCNVTMMLWPFVFLFNEKTRKFLITFLAYYSIYGGIITLFEPSSFYNGGNIFAWGSFKSFLSHSLLLLTGLYAFIAGFVKIEMKNNLAFLYGLFFIFLPIGLILNWIMNNNGFDINAMYLITPPLGEDQPFLNAWVISFMMVIANALFITVYETITLEKDQRWYNELLTKIKARRALKSE
ncbi:MAG TPA: YwaF family protein [Acholeplasmataceae bacterium]|jgi:hypothetical protein|nr:YwaF family protein [Acholeplasmataceae bacterium]